MEETNVKLFFKLTSDICDDITNVYEALADGDYKEGLEKIEEARKKLKNLKDNITKDEV